MDAKVPLPSPHNGSNWRQKFESALLERDNSVLPRRLCDAKHAIVDRIEDSFDTASMAERKLLLAALNTLSELQRLAQSEDSPSTRAIQVLGQAA